jgi:hypothetical protein
MVPARDSKEQGSELSGSWNLKGNWCIPRGRIGTVPSAFSTQTQKGKKMMMRSENHKGPENQLIVESSI